MSTLTIDVVLGRGAAPVSRAQCARIVATVARVLHRRFRGSMTVVYIGDARMRQLNARYRKIDRTTDVLSFCYARGRRGDTTLIEGELILSLPELIRAARQEQKSLRAVTSTRIVHGFLHLLGYDHERSAKDERIMFGLQEEILHCLHRKNF